MSSEILGATLMSYDTPAYLEFSSPAYTATEDQGKAVITVIRTGEFRIPVSVNYSTQDGTALAGQDYLATSGTLVIPAGVGISAFSIPLLADGRADGSKTVQLKLSNPGPGGQIIHGSATLTITDSSSASTARMLSVRPDGQGHVVISWPVGAACVLEKSSAACGGDWTAISAQPTVTNGTCNVVESVSAGSYFYRLRAE